MNVLQDDQVTARSPILLCATSPSRDTFNSDDMDSAEALIRGSSSNQDEETIPKPWYFSHFFQWNRSAVGNIEDPFEVVPLGFQNTPEQTTPHFVPITRSDFPG